MTSARRRVVKLVGFPRIVSCVRVQVTYCICFRNGGLVRELRITTTIRGVNSRASACHRMERSGFSTNKWTRYRLLLNKQDVRTILFFMQFFRIHAIIMCTIRHRANTRFVTRIMRKYGTRARRIMDTKYKCLTAATLVNRYFLSPKTRRDRIMTSITKR